MAAWDRRLHPQAGTSSHLRVDGPADLPTGPPYVLEPAPPVAGSPTLLRHPIVQTHTEWYGNINPFPIGYAFRPRLRGRLTLGGLPLPRKPWASGERSSHPFYRYSCRQSHFCGPTAVLTVHLVSPTERSPTTLPTARSAASVNSLSPVELSAQGRSTSELLRFL